MPAVLREDVSEWFELGCDSPFVLSGVWERLFKTLADDPDNEYAMIDATIVRAHQHSARAKAGITAVP